MKQFSGTIFSIIQIAMILFSIPSCDMRKCSPIPNGIAIHLVDSVNNNLIGSKYNRDTIKLILPEQTLTNIASDNIIKFCYSGFHKFNNSRYFLYLSYLDTDTLSVNIVVNDTKCGPEYHCTSLKYNSIEVQPEPSTYLRYKIVKK